MAGQFSSPFGANSNPFGGGQAQMHSLAEEDENGVAPQNTGFGGDAANDGPPASRTAPNSESYPAQYNFNRRTSVSAESLKPSADENDNWSPPFHQKSDEQIARLKKAIEGNFLFSHLEEEQSAQILGALVEKPIPAKDIKVSSSCRAIEPPARCS
jgi:cAMP-dependent protein kinase regulator